MNVLTIVGFGLPILGYFWFIAHYGVNVPYQDGWSDLTVIYQCYSHPFTCGALWTQHNENRLLFPNLIVVILAHTTHFNVKWEEFLSGLILVAATFLLIHAHKRRSPHVPWLYYCPVVILACSLVQYGATLWGFQLAWYLVLLALASVVVFLDRDKLGAPTLAACDQRRGDRELLVVARPSDLAGWDGAHFLPAPRLACRDGLGRRCLRNHCSLLLPPEYPLWNGLAEFTHSSPDIPDPLCHFCDW